jgi:hypothetical protein
VSVAFGIVGVRDTHCAFFNLVHSCSNIRTRSIGHVLDDWHMLERDANRRAGPAEKGRKEPQGDTTACSGNARIKAGEPVSYFVRKFTVPCG